MLQLLSDFIDVWLSHSIEKSLLKCLWFQLIFFILHPGSDRGIYILYLWDLIVHFLVQGEICIMSTNTNIS